MSVKAVAPPLNINNTAIDMVSNQSPATNMGNFSKPITPPAAVIKLSPEALQILNK